MAKDKSKMDSGEIIEPEKDIKTKEKHRWDDEAFISMNDMKKISKSIKEVKLKIRN